MKDVMGIIKIDEGEGSLKGITRSRPVATIPFGGRYRVIDFILSSMVNSGIRNVGILTRNKYRSIMDHLRSGKEWDLDRKRDGLFILPPDINTTMELYKGDLQNIYANIDYINKSSQKYVLITGSNIICNIDFNSAFIYHQETGADVTVIYKEEKNIDKLDFSHCTMLETREDGLITDMNVNPGRVISNKVSLDMYIMDKSLLVDLVDACVSRGYYDLVKDGFIKNINMLNIRGFPNECSSYKITSIENYYRSSIELLNPQIMHKLFFTPGLVYTKVKDEAPAKYLQEADVRNAIVANGCIIEGTVENSILFRGVRVRRGAFVKNCILMQKTDIGEDVWVENVITDKMVIISNGKRLIGVTSYPMVIDKETII